MLKKIILKFQECERKVIESKLCSETTFEDFCTADDDVIVSPLLDDAEMIKEVTVRKLLKFGILILMKRMKLLNPHLPQWQRPCCT